MEPVLGNVYVMVTRVTFSELWDWFLAKWCTWIASLHTRVHLHEVPIVVVFSYLQ